CGRGAGRYRHRPRAWLGLARRCRSRPVDRVGSTMSRHVCARRVHDGKGSTGLLEPARCRSRRAADAGGPTDRVMMDGMGGMLLGMGCYGSCLTSCSSSPPQRSSNTCDLTGPDEALRPSAVRRVAGSPTVHGGIVEATLALVEFAGILAVDRLAGEVMRLPVNDERDAFHQSLAL